MGPTASGKTDLALRLAEYFPIEIINVDSAQVYRQLNIGTGKVSHAIRQRIPHHLIDVVDLNQPYSAAQFSKEALKVIEEIKARQHIPLLVGGTMLYFKALQQGLSVLPSAQASIRAQLVQQAKEKGWQVLYQQLQQVDPLTAQRLHESDTQRIQRALEVYQSTGQPLSYWLSQPAFVSVSPYSFKNIALISLVSERSLLHQRISTRFEQMLQQGLIEEVENLLVQKVDVSLPALRSVGYRQVINYLLGKTNYEQMKASAIAATRQLAKRQLTWLRHWPGIINFDFNDEKLVEKIKPLFL